MTLKLTNPRIPDINNQLRWTIKPCPKGLTPINQTSYDVWTPWDAEQSSPAPSFPQCHRSYREQPQPFELLVALWSLYQYHCQTWNGSGNSTNHCQEPLQEVETSQDQWETPADHCCRMWMDISGNEGMSGPIGLRNIQNVIISSSIGIFIPRTIKIDITCCSNHHV